MSKVIYVFDKPDSCEQCKFCKIAKDSYYDFHVCKMTGSLMSSRAIDSKPKWCPLKEELPKMNIDEQTINHLYEKGIISAEYTPDRILGIEEGYNYCIDKIFEPKEVGYPCKD